MTRSTDAPKNLRRRVLRSLGVVAIIAAAGLAGAGVVLVLMGGYNVSALEQHIPLTYRVLDLALQRSIARRADTVEPPPLDDPALIENGLRHYREHCVQCHGAPGVARDPVGMAMNPLPPPLAASAKTMSSAELFWTIKHGIRMTGMPAWRFKFSDAQIWGIVAFLEQLPLLAPVEYQRWTAGVAATAAPTPNGEHVALQAPDPERGKTALFAYACTSCHSIPGLVGADANVGPPLADMADRKFIAGVLPNTFDNMVRWIRHPDEVDPLTAMPDLGVKAQDAADMAAYLYTLE